MPELEHTEKAFWESIHVLWGPTGVVISILLLGLLAAAGAFVTYVFRTRQDVLKQHTRDQDRSDTRVRVLEEQIEKAHTAKDGIAAMYREDLSKINALVSDVNEVLRRSQDLQVQTLEELKDGLKELRAELKEVENRVQLSVRDLKDRNL